jgi:hypothetical protein
MIRVGQSRTPRDDIYSNDFRKMAPFFSLLPETEIYRRERRWSSPQTKFSEFQAKPGRRAQLSPYPSSIQRPLGCAPDCSRKEHLAYEDFRRTTPSDPAKRNIQAHETFLSVPKSGIRRLAIFASSIAESQTALIHLGYKFGRNNKSLENRRIAKRRNHLTRSFNKLLEQ